MRKDWRDFAEHILEGIERVWDYRDRVQAGTADEDMATDAIHRLLETICEAASDKLPDAIKQRHPEIDWTAISGMRVRLAHIYLKIDRSIIEATITNDLARLYRAMRTELPDWEERKHRER